MLDASARVHAGRVVFQPDRWRVQTLASHTRNVALLAENWDHGRAFPGSPSDLAETRHRLVQAALIHDIAKPARFRLQYQPAPAQGGQWQYSFAGHRFDALYDDVYVQTLAQLHHEYSVAAITQHIARLRLQPEACAIADHLPLDLYALEMCDQIEASVASALLGGAEPEERVFMDFAVTRRSPACYEVDPFAFGESPLRITIDYVELIPPGEAIAEVMSARSTTERRAAIRQVQRWLLGALQTEALRHEEVEICPLIP